MPGKPHLEGISINQSKLDNTFVCHFVVPILFYNLEWSPGFSIAVECPDPTGGEGDVLNVIEGDTFQNVTWGRFSIIDDYGLEW